MAFKKIQKDEGQEAKKKRLTQSDLCSSRPNKKEIDKAPKVFAARIGFLMSFTITILMTIQLNTASFAVGGILIFFASLEFVLAIKQVVELVADSDTSANGSRNRRPF